MRFVRSTYAIIKLGLNSSRILGAEAWQSLWTWRTCQYFRGLSNHPQSVCGSVRGRGSDEVSTGVPINEYRLSTSHALVSTPQMRWCNCMHPSGKHLSWDEYRGTDLVVGNVLADGGHLVATFGVGMIKRLLQRFAWGLSAEGYGREERRIEQVSLLEVGCH